eukprot:2958857-Amphidinium_carterae.2
MATRYRAFGEESGRLLSQASLNKTVCARHVKCDVHTQMKHVSQQAKISELNKADDPEDDTDVSNPIDPEAASLAAVPDRDVEMKGTDEVPTFGYYKTLLAQLPKWTRTEVESNDSYNPVRKEIEGYNVPVDNMAALCEDVTTNTFVLITWNPECVIPPYEDCYEDGVSYAPSMTPLDLSALPASGHPSAYGFPLSSQADAKAKEDDGDMTVACGSPKNMQDNSEASLQSFEQEEEPEANEIELSANVVRSMEKWIDHEHAHRGVLKEEC